MSDNTQATDNLRTIKRLLDYSILQSKKALRYYANSTYETQRIIMTTKSKLYKKMMNDDVIKKIPKNEYERLIFLLAIDTYKTQKISNEQKAKIKEQRMLDKLQRQQRKDKKRTLYNIIKPLYTEIIVYRNQKATWQDIVNLLRKNHRSMFRGYKLTASYLRRVYNDIDRLYNDSTKSPTV